MRWDEVSALSAALTIFVVAAASVAAIVQLRHMQSANALNAIFGFMDKWMTREFQQMTTYVFSPELDAKLQDASYRRELMRVPADRVAHPELSMLDFWDQVASVVKSGIISEVGFMQSGAPAASINTFKRLSPVIVIVRKALGDSAYEDFEWLAARSTLYLERHPSTYPKDTPRIPVVDPFPDDPR